MNKNTKKIVNLLGNGTFIDNIYYFDTKNKQEIEEALEDLNIIYKEPEYLYMTRHMEDYWIIGVSENKLIKFSYDYQEDICFSDKEEFYLIPFMFFSDAYSNSDDLEKMTYSYFLIQIEMSLSENTKGVYEYAQDMIKYIEWYKEQGYPLYEYIPRLEVFLKGQIELWKDKFEEILKEESSD